ncbi:sodium:proton symporter [Roseibium sp. CAU 1637]|uniref:Sodium:proton symporter n=1 Tax=Roseibium limicola TaxID=2816037 RepID=A0A939ELT1_9HYPH|nr:sodium:proton symporter [Roseibium limicola]MBO0344924.1 sodium:proton symporter [Roseibium limicola]
MFLLKLPLIVVERLGRHAPFALWISLALGMGFPGLSELVRPFLGSLVFLLLTLAFLRVDPVPVIAHLRRPLPVILASLWMLLLLPLAATLLLHLLPTGLVTPDIALIVFLICAAPPVMSAPGFIAMMGLNASFGLALLIVTMMLTPLTAPVFAELMTAGEMQIDATALALRLAGYLVGSLLLARTVRAVIGKDRIQAGGMRIDGLNVLLLFCFALAAMDGVADSFAASPLLSASIAALTFFAAFVQIGITLIVFRKLGRQDAFALAHSSGSRNMGLMVAGFGGHIPELTWLWFALGQFPIYMLPMLLKPFARRFTAPKQPRDAGADTPLE